MPLSDNWLRAINGKPYLGKPELADRNGLSVRITPAGTITWQYRFRIDNPSGA
ncbi:MULTISPECIES: Arm DNA-binding domain-containing protein [unclassified Shewanella]|uniref:Arm DNA-binding domain-containing protein n=1 Tax=Shewanella TaxID=22 RepID=UPI003987FE48